MAANDERGAGSRSEVRRDIQALRALAVILVVAFHLFPEAVPAGFVGVDAFFVISGFLITAHLTREAESRGRVQVGRFWAARARRLLPASYLVLLVCLIATVFLVTPSIQGRYLREISGALYYVLNWTLASETVDYWAAEDTGSAVQHFWSLSVEEQFYLVWPLLFVCALAVPRRGAAAKVPLRWMVLALLLLSLGLSVASAARQQPADYFPTWNRAWEFAVGGALALFARLRTASIATRSLAWLGLLVITGSAWLLPQGVAFPGFWALVPVLGTALALRFGESLGAVEARVLHGRAVQWIGDASYSIYLWHWPLIVFYRTGFDGRIDALSASGLVVATVVLSALTKVFVEDKVRYHPFLLRRSPWLTFLLAGVIMAGLGAGASWAFARQLAITDVRHPLMDRLRQRQIACFGANAVAGCRNPSIASLVLPNPSAAKADHARLCMADNQGETTVQVCARGAKKKAARTTTALVGDSHAGHLLPMLEFGAAGRRERILQYLKGSCPFNTHARDTFALLRNSCETFKDKVRAEIQKNESISRVVLSASATSVLVVEPGMDEFESAVLGYMQAIAALPAHVREVIVVRDTPRMHRKATQCLERLGTPALQLAPGACGRRRSSSLVPDPLAEAGRRLGGRVHVLDFADVICTGARCNPIVHNAVAYRDTHHLTETFALTLAPRYQAFLRAIAEEQQTE